MVEGVGVRGSEGDLGKRDGGEGMSHCDALTVADASYLCDAGFARGENHGDSQHLCTFALGRVHNFSLWQFRVTTRR